MKLCFLILQTCSWCQNCPFARGKYKRSLLSLVGLKHVTQKHPEMKITPSLYVITPARQTPRKHVNLFVKVEVSSYLGLMDMSVLRLYFEPQRNYRIFEETIRALNHAPRIRFDLVLENNTTY